MPKKGKPAEDGSPPSGFSSKKRKRRLEGEPVPPRTAYNFFFKDEHEHIRAAPVGQAASSSSASSIGAKWRGLDDQIRGKYERMAVQDKRRYAIEIVEWKQSRQQQQRHQAAGTAVSVARPKTTGETGNSSNSSIAGWGPAAVEKVTASLLGSPVSAATVETRRMQELREQATHSHRIQQQGKEKSSFMMDEKVSESTEDQLQLQLQQQLGASTSSNTTEPRTARARTSTNVTSYAPLSLPPLRERWQSEVYYPQRRLGDYAAVQDSVRGQGGEEVSALRSPFSKYQGGPFTASEPPNPAQFPQVGGVRADQQAHQYPVQRTPQPTQQQQQRQQVSSFAALLPQEFIPDRGSLAWVAQELGSEGVNLFIQMFRHKSG